MTSRHLLFALCASLFACTAAAQPQWRFHLAFEDGTGARDTIWFVYDTTATTGSDINPLVDVDLGEGAVEMDLDAFNVFVWNWQWDSTKTKAWPYTWFPYGHMVIEAFNYTAPVTIRWDTSLFTSPVLPITPDIYIGQAELLSDYFWLTGQVTDYGFGMLNADSVIVDDPEFMFSQLIMVFNQHSGLSVIEQNRHSIDRVFPNPTLGLVTLKIPETVHLVEVFDSLGRRMFEFRPMTIEPQLDLSQLPAGTYNLRAFTSNGIHHGKLIKVENTP